VQTTLGIIKPEAIVRGIVKEIEKRILRAKMKIISSRQIILRENEFDLIYKSVKEPDWLHNARREYMTHLPVILLRIEGHDSVRRLLDLRGYSNPKYAAPGTIRADFARDQDYIELRKQRRIALNVFHACDSEEEALRLVDYFKLR